MAVPLRAEILADGAPRDGAYVLLNGSKGGFCLNAELPSPDDHTRADAWSANVGRYVAISGSVVHVQRWDRRQAIQEFSLSRVQNELDDFYDFLRSEPPLADATVVAHSLRALRQVRAALGPSAGGVEALRAFLSLLANAEETDLLPRDFPKWGLDDQALDAMQRLSPATRSALILGLCSGPKGSALQLDVDVLLRHAAGAIFQDAHYELVVLGGDQLLLDGFLPTKTLTKPSPARLGLHFTPPSLVRTIVEEALREIQLGPGPVTLFDPACGSGEFLREGLRALRRHGCSSPVRLIGWDVSEAACIMARFALAAAKRDQNLEVVIDIEHLNSLSQDVSWPKNVDVALMNPPFISLNDQSEAMRSTVRQILGPLVQKRPDVAAAFWWRAAESIRPGGVLATILPAALLDGDSVAPLREAIGASLEPRLMGRLGSQDLFAAARVDAGLYIGRKRQEAKPGSLQANEPAHPPIAIWIDHREKSHADALRSLRRSDHEQLPIVRPGYSLYRDPTMGRDSSSWAPRPYQARLLAQKLSLSPRVRELFDVHQGVLTGDNETFLLTEEDWFRLPKRERAYFRPALLNRSVKAGRLSTDARVFYPYGDREIRSSAELRKTVPHYYAKWLEPAKHRLQKRRGRSDRWWHLSEPRAWQKARERRLVSTYFGGAGSFGFDEGGDVVVVQGYAWLWGENRNHLTPEVPALAYLALLNSPVFGLLLGAFANHVGGGQWNLSSRFVSSMPLPNLTGEDIRPEVVQGLASIGRRMASGAYSDASPHELTELASAAYGIATADLVLSSVLT